MAHGLTDEVFQLRDVQPPRRDLFYLAYAEDQWGPILAARGHAWRCLVPECENATVGDPCAHMQAVTAALRPPPDLRLPQRPVNPAVFCD